jgi:hypothetical protein
MLDVYLMILSAEDIKELDRRLDAAVPSQLLLARPRDVALIHLLRAHESYMVGEVSNPNRGERDNASTHGMDAMNHAVQWIFQFCPSASGSTLGFDDNAYREAEQLHKLAREYSKIWDLMSLLHRSLITGSKSGDDTVELHYSSDLDMGLQIAANFIAAPYGPVLDEPIVTPNVAKEILSAITVQRNEHQFTYQVPDSLFRQLFERVNRLTAEPWEMDPTWDLGGYTIGQLHKFRVTLDTLCVIHGQVSRSLGDAHKILSSIIKTHPRNIWERILTRKSKLPKDVVTAILTDLIYDPELYGPGKKQPHITFHPIFRFGSNLLAVSNWLLHVSNIERNVWDLVSIKRPQLHGTLRNLKERSWIEELQRKTQQLGLNLYPNIKFEFGGQKSDLDTLIIDPKAQFGLVCELKWLLSAGRISGVVANDSEIKKGIKQAQLALDWVRSIPAQLVHRTDLSADELSKFEFRPMVLCKNTLASGFLRQPGVPVMNERLFDWILGEPHKKDLRTVWRVGEELSYLPKEGKHFNTIDASTEFGGIKFNLHGLAFAPKAPWKPSEDIRIPALS